MLFAMRVSIPDRPGMLGAVATALSDGGANIVSLDVIDRSDGMAVDDMCIEGPDGLADALRRAAEEVPGAVVEAVRPITRLKDPLSPMELASSIVASSPENAVQTLVDGIPEAMWASWCSALRLTGDVLEPLAASAGATSLGNLETPWFPLDAPRRFAHAPWMPPAWRMGRLGYEVAAVPLGEPYEALLVVRRHGPRFRTSELRQLGALSRITVQVRAIDRPRDQAASA